MNLTCEALRDLLLDHDAGELVVEVREQFDSHLVACSKCLYLVESYRHTVRIARALPRCELPPGVEARLRAAMKPHLDAGE